MVRHRWRVGPWLTLRSRLTLGLAPPFPLVSQAAGWFGIFTSAYAFYIAMAVLIEVGQGTCWGSGVGASQRGWWRQWPGGRHLSSSAATSVALLCFRNAYEPTPLSVSLSPAGHVGPGGPAPLVSLLCASCAALVSRQQQRLARMQPCQRLANALMLAGFAPAAAADCWLLLITPAAGPNGIAPSSAPATLAGLPLPCLPPPALPHFMPCPPSPPVPQLHQALQEARQDPVPARLR